MDNIASKADRKFLTTLSFSQQIGVAIFKSYESESKCNLIKKRSIDLQNSSEKYLKYFAPKSEMTDKNLAKIAGVVSKMMDGGLDTTKSFQTYLSLLIGMFSEREVELREHNGNQDKISCMVELQEITDKCWVYFSSRTRKDEFDELGFHLLDVFNCELE